MVKQFVYRDSLEKNQSNNILDNIKVCSNYKAIINEIIIFNFVFISYVYFL